MDDFFVADGGVGDCVFHGGQLKSERKLMCAQDGCLPVPTSRSFGDGKREQVQLGFSKATFFCLSAKSRRDAPRHVTPRIN